MKRIIAALLVLWLAPPTRAAVIDLSLLTCQEFLQSNKDEVRIILAWLDGYYKEEQDPPIIDSNALTASLMRLNEYCTANPTTDLMTAADKLFER